MNAHTLDVVATEFRVAGRIVQETVAGIRRTGWMNWVIVITMASILSIFGSVFTFLIEGQNLVDNLSTGLKVSVYLKPHTNIAEAQLLVKGLPHVKSVNLVTKERAWEDMKRNYKVPDIRNPLPDTLHVQVDSAESIEATVNSLQRMQGVESVNYAEAMLRKLQQVSKITSFVGMVVSLFLGLLTMFIISNTIHLLIEARGREIEILRMMGVGNWYIRLPFLMQGSFYGLLGALLAYVPLSFTEHYMGLLLENFRFVSNGQAHSLVFTVVLCIGVVVGAGGSEISIRKYLHL